MSCRKAKAMKLIFSFYFLLLCTPCAMSQELPGRYSVSWLGNTYGKGHKDPNSTEGQWIQNYIDSMFVDKDGTCYTASIWDEGGRTHGVYKEGVCVGNRKDYVFTSSFAGGFHIERVQKTNPKNGQKEWVPVKVVGKGRELKGCGTPVALAMGTGIYEGNLLVADNDSKQILIYDIKREEPRIVHRFGVEGGVGGAYKARYSIPESKNAPSYPARRYLPGEYHPFKFWTITGVGMDEKGRLFVSTSELGSSIRCFKLDSKKRWILDWTVQNFIFVDNASPDYSSDATDVYTVQERYSMNYDNIRPGSEWRIKSITVDEKKYPNDPRALLWVKAGHEHGCTSAAVRRVFGKRFLFVNGMTCQWPFIFRFEDHSDIAAPSGCIMKPHRIYDLKPDVFWLPGCPRDGRQYIWRDLNGDGDFQANEYTATSFGYPDGSAYWVDSKGGIWVSSRNVIQRYVPAGLDKHGNLIYDDAHTERHELSGIDNVGRIVWQENEDRLVLVDKCCRDLKGGSIYLVDNWSRGNLSARNIGKLKGPNPSSVTAAGDYLFEVGWESRAEVFVTDLRTGKYLGSMVPSKDMGGVECTGWVDIAYGIDAMRRSNEEYVVFVEDDYMGKVIMYRWRPEAN